jgi:16S rRNA (cytidine1402-2'-O)-methyltransferase
MMATQTASYPQRQRTTNGGRLYLVATPIGNLEDITLRALRVLKEADVIACEDTRQTAKLLNHYGIHKRAISYHEHNEVMKAPELVLEMEEGLRVALVSDAGTPGISDPGHHLVSLAIRHGIPVVPVPGPSAFAASLAASGLPTDHFHFIGFLPARRTQRRKMLKALSDDPGTFVFYEAPHRLAASLADMLALLGNRQVVIAREVTKVHEEFLRGRLKDLAAWAKRRRVKGEITIMVAPHDEESLAQPTRRRSSLCARVDEIRKERGLDLRGALKIVAHELGISRSEAYRRLQEEKALQ